MTDENLSLLEKKSQVRLIKTAIEIQQKIPDVKKDIYRFSKNISYFIRFLGG